MPDYGDDLPDLPPLPGVAADEVVKAIALPDDPAMMSVEAAILAAPKPAGPSKTTGGKERPRCAFAGCDKQVNRS
jgi:hypothetical protein